MANLELDNPFLEALGATFTEWRAGYAEFTMPIQAGHLNRQRILQGGAIATLLDAACGYAGLFTMGDAPVHGFTLSLTVNYLDRGIGDKVVAKGFLERQGRSVYFARGEAWVDDRVMIASAQGTFKYAR
ncbi:PaaI family thioesterase [Caballeronia novacaledonica]|uniref:PaaI family thioesterase n=1 Tax=Caballeronia novacaledonica TaxID=1544861 RepID=UPI001EE1BEEC|nr:PaaI family thioesterase [Caballeronia novacaledonica]GJH10980.1 PaaI family thioesterase [Caballeronia novacaledonica]